MFIYIHIYISYLYIYVYIYMYVYIYICIYAADLLKRRLASWCAAPCYQVCVCVWERVCVCVRTFVCVCMHIYIYIYMYIYINIIYIYVCVYIYIYVCIYSVCCGSFLFLTWLTHTFDTPHSYVCTDSFICVTSVRELIHKCDMCAMKETLSWCVTMPHSYARPWHIHMCDHDSFIYVTMTHTHVCLTHMRCIQRMRVAKQNFSKVSSPLNLLYQISIELTCENFCQMEGAVHQKVNILKSQFAKILNRQFATKISIQTNCRASFWEFPSSSTPPCSASSFMRILKS